ncbi:Prepilin-type N-terminal cleavage/methylation domain-containing protein [Halomonas sp. NYA30]
MSKHWQTGFTLVELMVAMAVGSIVILGAGQLFLTTFQTFRAVDELSRKQETVIFAANNLVNAYRRGGAEYTLKPTTDTPDECSIQANDEPIVGGLAQFDGECSAERFISAGELAPGQTLDGYHRFTFDFGRDDEQLETLSFHVMKRPPQEEVCPMPGTSEGDAFISGSRVPSPASYIQELRNAEVVVNTCSVSEISSSSEKFFYCNDNLNDLDIGGMDSKVIMAEQNITFQMNDNKSVSNVALVAMNAINMSGNNNVNATLSGVFWSAQNIGLGASGVHFSGSVLSTNNYTMNNFTSQEESREPWCLLEPYYSLFENIGE